MATLTINGKRVKVDDSFLSLSPEQQNATVDEIASQMGATQPAPQQDTNAAQLQQAGMPVVDPSMQSDGNSPSPAFQQALAQLHQAAGNLKDAPTEDRDRLVRANMEATKINNMQGDKGILRRGAEAAGANLPFADEAYSTIVGAPMRMLTDQVGYGEGYKRSQALLAAQKERRGTAANLIGDVAGGLAAGGTLAKGGATLMGRTVPFLSEAVPKTTAGLLAATEGGLYGGIYGAGEGQGLDQRLSNAGWGAATGAATGLGAEALGSVASKLLTPKGGTPAPAVEELATASKNLYSKARSAGIAVKPGALDRVANNVEFAAGNINEKLRPKTAGIVDEMQAMKGKPLDLERLDEFRQTINQAMGRAESQDVRTLSRIKKVVDHFADNATASDITGDIKGFGYIKEARKLYSQKMKAQKIENLLDLADVDTGKYTQSGMSNTIRQRMAQLYRQIKKGQDKSWSKDEVALIRQMAKGGSNSQMVNWISKFAPRGIVSAGLGQMMGAGATAALGPIGLGLNVAIPAAGAIAGRAADRGAMGAATALRDAAARGFVQKLPKLANHLRPAVGGLTAGTLELIQSR
jgi:hypothetical protein